MSFSSTLGNLPKKVLSSLSWVWNGIDTRPQTPLRSELMASKSQGYFNKLKANQKTTRIYCNLVAGTLYFFKDRQRMSQFMVDHYLCITNWYGVFSSRSAIGCLSQFQIVLGQKDKMLVLFTGERTLFSCFSRELEKHTIKINIESELELLGSAHSQIKKEFMFLQERQSRNKRIAQFIGKSFTQKKPGLSWFLNQLKLLRKLSHPNILSLRQVYEEKNCFVLVYEEWKPTTEAVSLYLFLKSFKSLEEVTSYQLARSLMAATEYLHAAEKCLHNFIREENIFISIDQEDRLEIVLTNFRYASELSSTVPFKTGFGPVDSFPGYLSPELFSQKAGLLTTALDLYCIGVILLRCFTGKTYSDLMRNRFCLKDIWLTGLDEAASELLRTLLQKDPLKRGSRKDVSQVLQKRWSVLADLSKEDSQLINNRLRVNIKSLSSMTRNLTFKDGSKLTELVMEDIKPPESPGEKELSSNSAENIPAMHFPTQKSHHASLGHQMMPSIIQEFESFNEISNSTSKHEMLIENRKSLGNELQPISSNFYCSGGSNHSRHLSNLSLESERSYPDEANDFLDPKEDELASYKMLQLEKISRKTKFFHKN